MISICARTATTTTPGHIPMGTDTRAKRCMKRSSKLLRRWVHPIAVACVGLSMVCLGVSAIQGQTLGQQVESQPMGSTGGTQSTGTGAVGNPYGQSVGQSTNGNVQQT